MPALAVVRWCRWWRWPSFLPPFCRKNARRRGVPFVLLDIIQTERHFFASLLSFRPLSVSDLTISAGFGCFVGGGCRLPDGHGMEPWRSPPLAVAVGQLFSPEHRPPGDSPSLPSPLLLFGHQCLRLVVCGLLCCFPSPAVPLGALVLVSALLGVVVWGGIFYYFQPRPELTRAHA